MYYRVFIHSDADNPFPERNTPNLNQAHDFILEAVECLEEGDKELLDDGVPFFFITFVY
jgi:hypothetical protein